MSFSSLGSNKIWTVAPVSFLLPGVYMLVAYVHMLQIPFEGILVYRLVLRIIVYYYRL